ncbi:hypothetical protein CPB84DRAFT_288028 [Gymnopilus junonius]|uniref:Uncharacterized protein n=1 Tax=Gymnopilus junonius TaxID=109634 RepID=A0A9P5NDH2_GYMJU|nr:hypothetical protein CPB84DRAFT_288028 [Gymnopilus junonius]
MDLLSKIQNTTFISPGDSWDFDFLGYSMGVYVTFNNTETSFSEIAASYTLDGEEPINFIIQNTEVDAHYFGTQALILQLPKNPLGQHHLQVNFPDIHEPTPLRFEQIIVQNTTSRTLPPFPTPLTGVLTHGSPGVTNLGTSIGVAVGVGTLLLAIVLYTIFRYRQKRITLLKEIGNSELAARPFLLPRILRIEAAKRRGPSIQLLPQRREHTKAVRGPHNVNVDGVTEEGQHAVQRAVIIHVDSEDQQNDGEQETGPLELPPAYRSVLRSETITSPEHHPISLPPILEPTTTVIHIQEKSTTGTGTGIGSG